MCGRYSITSPPEAVRRVFGYPEQPNFPPRYNIAPTQPVPIVRRAAAGEGRREFVLVRWGLVPSWAREIGSKPLINARSETVADKPAFRGAFRHRRCLVPADGYYEWWRGGSGRPQPYNIRRKDGGLFAMAGIWETWVGADGSELDSMAILTRAATPVLRPIHDRMPCVVRNEDFDAWLDPIATSRREALGLLGLAGGLGREADDTFVATPVSTDVNTVANDGPGLHVEVQVADGPGAPEPAPRLL